MRRHRMALFVAALCAFVAISALLPGETARGALAQSGVLATLGLAAAGLARGGALGLPNAAPGTRAERRRGLSWAAFVLAVGLLGGVAGAAAAGGAVGGATPARIAAVAAICLLTGVFEEGVFRVAAMEAFEDAFGRGDARSTVRAAAASAVVFGLVHLSTGDAARAASLGVAAWAQLALKPVQAALFGLCLAALYARTRSLWPAAALHAAFDLLYLGPAMLADVAFQVVYVTGAPADAAVLAATTLLLALPAAAAVRALLGRGAPREGLS